MQKSLRNMSFSCRRGRGAQPLFIHRSRMVQRSFTCRLHCGESERPRHLVWRPSCRRMAGLALPSVAFLRSLVQTSRLRAYIRQDAMSDASKVSVRRPLARVSQEQVPVPVCRAREPGTECSTAGTSPCHDTSRIASAKLMARLGEEVPVTVLVFCLDRRLLEARLVANA